MKRWEAVGQVAKLLIQKEHPAYALVLMLAAIVFPAVCGVLVLALLLIESPAGHHAKCEYRIATDPAGTSRPN